MGAKKTFPNGVLCHRNGAIVAEREGAARSTDHKSTCCGNGESLLGGGNRDAGSHGTSRLAVLT
jgi:hypothetical protein